MAGAFRGFDFAQGESGGGILYIFMSCLVALWFLFVMMAVIKCSCVFGMVGVAWGL